MWNVLEEYTKIIKSRKLKLTNARLAFVKAITSMDKKHFTISEIIAKIKENEGHVNIMSCYNILELLLKEHLLFANTLDGKNVSYELITPRLVHVRCDYCGKLYHLDDGVLGVHNKWWDLFNELANKYAIAEENKITIIPLGLS